MAVTIGSTTRAPTEPQTHDVSKLHVRVMIWRAERIGPMIIDAPQCGHVHVARIGAAVSAGPGVPSVAGADVPGAASRVRARAT